MACKNGFIVPFLTLIFKIFECMSPLTLFRRLSHIFHKEFGWSHLAVEIYVLVWFFLLVGFIWLIWAMEPFPLCILIFLTAIFIWRLLDISQSWFNIFMKKEVEVLSPVRSLVLAVINYFEISIIFALLSFLFREGNFNPSFTTVTESLRHSIGVITTTGSRFDPASVAGGLLYYFEIAFGLAFLAVVISRIMSVFRVKKQ